MTASKPWTPAQWDPSPDRAGDRWLSGALPPPEYPAMTADGVRGAGLLGWWDGETVRKVTVVGAWDGTGVVAVQPGAG